MASGATGSTEQEHRPPGIGVFGGSFNPPHKSHVRIARQALEALPINELRVIPSGDHPHKAGRDMAPARHRLAMCRLAFDLPRVVVDDRELRRDGPSFTVDTLAELRTELAVERIFFLIGSDNLPLLPTWHQHHRLLQLATVVTYPRLGHAIRASDLDSLDLDADERRMLLANVLDVPADAIAASEVRARRRTGARVLPDLPAAVARYIEANDLYR